MDEKTIKCALDKLANLAGSGYAECMLASLYRYDMQSKKDEYSSDVFEAMDLVDKLVNDVFKYDYWYVDSLSCRFKMFKAGSEKWYEIYADRRKEDKPNCQSQTYALCAAGYDIKHTKSIICNLFRMFDSCKTIKVVEYTSENSVMSFSKDSDEMQCFIFDCALRGIDLDEVMSKHD